MGKSSMSFIKGVGAGALAGMAVATAGAMILKNKKAFGKNAKKAVNAMGDIVDSVHDMFK